MAYPYIASSQDLVHLVLIAEDVIYLESGKIVRHQHEGVHYAQ